MAALTWLWFEIFRYSNISLSLTLTFSQFGEPQVFVALTGVVYFGDVHFTTHWHDHSGVWWKCDGSKHHVSPVVNVTNTESDLLQCKVPVSRSLNLIMSLLNLEIQQSSTEFEAAPPRQPNSIGA